MGECVVNHISYSGHTENSGKLVSLVQRINGINGFFRGVIYVFLVRRF